MNFASMLPSFANRRQILLAAIGVFLFFNVNFAQEKDGAETKNAVEVFNQGQDAHEKGDYAAALKFYEAALKIAPEFPEAELQRGSALVSLNRTDEAEKAFRRALELRADWTLPMTKLGELLVRKQREQNNPEEAKRLYGEATKILLKAIELDANNFLAFSALTELQLRSSASADVLRELLARIKNITDGKKNAPAFIWASRAALENALNDKTAAKASVARALAIEADNKPALAERAEIALTEGDFERADADAKTLLQMSPESIPFKLLQARIYAAQGKTGEALKILDALKNSSKAASLRGEITASDSASAADLEKQLEANARNATVLSRLCIVLRTENPLKALDYCRRASEAEPTNINHAVGFGAALVQAKQFENAVVVLRRVLQIAPDNFTARANLATALFELKRFAEAETEYSWLTEKQPDLAIAYYFLAIAHDNLGEYADAMANYQLFLKRADAANNQLEIEKVNLRLPALQNQIKKGGKKSK